LLAGIPPRAAVGASATEALLDCLPEFGLDDGLVLARIDVAAMGNLAAVDSVLKKVKQRPSPHGPAVFAGDTIGNEMLLH